MEEEPILQGYLIKRGGLVKNWKIRWFVLTRTAHLVYYREKSDTRAKGTVYLDAECSIVPGAQCQDPSVFEKPNDSFCLSTPARKYYVTARNKAECDVWIRKIKIVISLQSDPPEVRKQRQEDAIKAAKEREAKQNEEKQHNRHQQDDPESVAKKPKSLPAPEIPHSVSSVPRHLRGISGLVLKQVRGKVTPDMATRHVVQYLIQPSTKAKDSAYTDTLIHQHLNRKSSRPIETLVGQATVFVCHNWSSKFVDVVDALLEYGAKRKAVTGEEQFFWFDVFVVNQHIGRDISAQWWVDTFPSVIREIGRTVAVVSTFKRVGILSRAWCLYEILCTELNGCDLDIQLTPTHKDELEEEPELFMDALRKCKFSTAKTYKASDQTMILYAVGKLLPGPAVSADLMVAKPFNEWIVKELIQ